MVKTLSFQGVRRDFGHAVSFCKPIQRDETHPVVLDVDVLRAPSAGFVRCVQICIARGKALIRNAVTQNSPDFNRPGCLPRRAHIQGFSLYRSAPFVPKGFHLCDQPLINISRNSIAPINFISRIIYFVNGRLQKLLNILWLRYAFACIGVFNQPHKRIKFQWDNLGLASISSDISDLI